MKLFRIFVAFAVALVIWNSCVDLESKDPDLQINLRWVKAYPTESREHVTAGLSWCLSFLGASLPSDFQIDSTEWKSETLLTLDLAKAGFSQESLAAWRILIPKLKESDEYVNHKAIDIGRFVMLTLNSANHYNAIMVAEKRLPDFRKKYKFLKKKGAIINSSIALENRVIEVSDAGEFGEIAFIATEGTGSIQDNSFIEKEFEIMTLMSNGQLRFALYDLNGNLKTSASPDLTNAGKTAKCLWCHEINLASILSESPPVENYLTDIEYNSLIADRVKMINKYRASLADGVDFSLTQQHTKGELLYLSFMEPSAIAWRWNGT